ncbi:DMT family transporter [bacterium]|nr:DMT family transporter [bacterium]
MRKPSKWLPGFIALGLVWGLSFLFVELALISFTPIGIAFLRGLLGAVSLLVLVAVTRQKLPRVWRHWLHISIVAVLLNAAPGFLFALGQETVSSSIAGVINATTPLMTVLIIISFFRDQTPTVDQFLGIVVGFFGILLVMEIFSSSNQASVAGVITLLMATLCYGLAMPYAKRFVSPLPYSPYVLAASQVSASAALTALPAILWGITHDVITGTSLAGIALLGVLGTGVAYVWNYRNIELAGSVVASSVTYITPVVAVIAGVLVLGDQLSPSQVAGGILIVLSALLVQGRLRVTRTRNR